MPLKLLVLVLPLSLDTFAVSAAMGAAGLDRRERLRLTAVLAGFEAGMPILGFLVGSAVGARLGDAGDWVAIAVLAAVGGFMLVEEGDDEEPGRLRRTRGWSMVWLGLGVSIDELAVGLAVGLLGAPILLVAALIAAQACLATQAGAMLGARLGARTRGGAERLAGMMLLLLATGLLVLRLTNHA